MAKELENGRILCEQCGNDYKGIGNHWSQSNCSYAEIDGETIELLKGFILGDGHLSERKKNPRVDVMNTNLRFLEWLDNKLGWLSCGVRLYATADEVAERITNGFGRESDVRKCNHAFKLYTRNHEKLNIFESWYNESTASIPNGETFTKEGILSWYVSDGYLYNERDGCSQVSVASKNEMDNGESVCDLIEDHGFDVIQSGKTFLIPVDQTPEFLEYIGPAPPGFEHKWVLDYDEHNLIREEMYDYGREYIEEVVSYEAADRIF